MITITLNTHRTRQMLLPPLAKERPFKPDRRSGCHRARARKPKLLLRKCKMVVLANSSRPSHQYQISTVSNRTHLIPLQSCLQPLLRRYQVDTIFRQSIIITPVLLRLRLAMLAAHQAIISRAIMLHRMVTATHMERIWPWGPVVICTSRTVGTGG